MNGKPRGFVHYVLNNGECRPFLITRAWNDTVVNGTLFIDGSNDYSNIPQFRPPPQPYTQGSILTVWRTSVHLGNEPNDWHYPESESSTKEFNLATARLGNDKWYDHEKGLYEYRGEID